MYLTHCSMIGKISKFWNIYLEKFQSNQKDTYFTEEYIRLYETEKEKAFCFIYQDKENTFLFPYLRRICKIEDDIEYYDFETAYGYGGPISTTDNIYFLQDAWKTFYDTAKENNYVAGFIRFHPIFNNTKSFESIGKLIQDRNTVAIDLHGTEEEIWMKEIHTKNRNVIKKGIKTGLIFEVDNTFQYMDEFIDIYNSTMDKLNADSFYYFTNDYYTNLKNKLKNSFLGIVKYNKQIISCAIFFYESKWGHYHLAGSKKEFLNLSPNNFLLWEAAKELKKRDVEYFHLGGGTNSDVNNSLFQFKRKFSKSLYQFEIGKVIFNEEIYNELCKNWETNNPDKKETYKHHLLKYKY